MAASEKMVRSMRDSVSNLRGGACEARHPFTVVLALERTSHRLGAGQGQGHTTVSQAVEAASPYTCYGTKHSVDDNTSSILASGDLSTQELTHGDPGGIAEVKSPRTTPHEPSLT